MGGSRTSESQIHQFCTMGKNCSSQHGSRPISQGHPTASIGTLRPRPAAAVMVEVFVSGRGGTRTRAGIVRWTVLTYQASSRQYMIVYTSGSRVCGAEGPTKPTSRAATANWSARDANEPWQRGDDEAAGTRASSLLTLAPQPSNSEARTLYGLVKEPVVQTAAFQS